MTYVEATEVNKLAAVEDRHWWYRERRTLLRRLAWSLFPGGTAGRVALDVGAAAGGNTRVLRDLGFFAVPVEFGQDGVEVARDRGLAVVRADARRLPVRSAAVDLVVAFDVLEHIEEDQTVLADVRRILRPGGVLLVAVPADMRLWSAHDEAVGHVRRYSRGGLAAITIDSGFELEEIWSWNVLLRPLVRARRKLLRGSDLTDVGSLANVALGGVVLLERKLGWLRRRQGVSLFMIARRPASASAD